MTLVVAAFYKFVKLPDFAALRSPIFTYCQEQGIKGTILLAPEGINGTIAGTEAGIEAVFDYLREESRFADLEPRRSYTESYPFERLKVKLKPEIVTLGVPEADPSEQVGIYLEPQQWNEKISNPAVTVIDTRNRYEVEIGTFKGAQNPQTASFREFPEYISRHLDPGQHPEVALFCTGGIRCEKATAFLLKQGFRQVYHLKGGILKYLAEVPPQESLWEGECFVFDERVALQHGLQPGRYAMCQACGHPISAEDQASPDYKYDSSCPYCFDKLTPEKR
ncbi:MAG: rhodanese-related sulfurtransferase [Chloroflexaceae bacterium]|nr:rhodanese-related sulfurtransferase [Chloroflexaceae bacterium]